MLQIISCHRKEGDSEFRQDLKMLLGFQNEDNVNTLINLTASYSNRDIGDYDEEDSLAVTDEDDEEEDEEEDEGIDEDGDGWPEDDDDDDDDDGFVEDDEYDDEENSMDSEEMAQYAQMVAEDAHQRDGDGGGRRAARRRGGPEDDDSQEHESSQESQEEGEEGEMDDEGEEEDDDDEDDEDDEDDHNDNENHDGPKTRVDYQLKMSHPGIDKGAAKVLMSISFTACSRHAWDPEFYEDDGKERGDANALDFYVRLERTGTGGAYGTISRNDEFDNRLMWARESRPVRLNLKKKLENFFVFDMCECVLCNTRHKFRVEINWNALYQLVNALQPAFGEDCRIEPSVVHRFEQRIADQSDTIYSFIRAVRVLAFFMIYTAGSSGYAVSPVDFFFGNVVAEGIPHFSGLRLSEFYADYESDGSLGVD